MPSVWVVPMALGPVAPHSPQDGVAFHRSTFGATEASIALWTVALPPQKGQGGCSEVRALASRAIFSSMGA
jgi:hypothetical protein